MAVGREPSAEFFDINVSTNDLQQSLLQPVEPFTLFFVINTEKITGVTVMSGNIGLYIFTEERLMEFAANIHNASVLSTIRKMNKMTSPQQVRAMRNNGASLRWDEKTLKNVVDANIKP
ncbi:hypothetical protein [uncultured Endozoicomonas sp.]|uniref:hypothetical protein n=1 Tax=uncultured Endozoicomonas sp. TaxID=432652 RepID=UPI0026295A14|nr:hypothetical protein [uncultured Endozoicomonas sp.]